MADREQIGARSKVPAFNLTPSSSPSEAECPLNTWEYADSLLKERTAKFHVKTPASRPEDFRDEHVRTGNRVELSAARLQDADSFNDNFVDNVTESCLEVGVLRNPSGLSRRFDASMSVRDKRIQDTTDPACLPIFGTLRYTVDRSRQLDVGLSSYDMVDTSQLVNVGSS
jgi:hypothetical protein